MLKKIQGTQMLKSEALIESEKLKSTMAEAIRLYDELSIESPDIAQLLDLIAGPQKFKERMGLYVGLIDDSVKKIEGGDIVYVCDKCNQEFVHKIYVAKPSTCEDCECKHRDILVTAEKVTCKECECDL